MKMTTDDVVSRRIASNSAARLGSTGLERPTLDERMAPWGVAIFGADLLICGATRRSWRRVGLVVGGVGLLACSALGFCSVPSSNAIAGDGGPRYVATCMSRTAARCRTVNPCRVYRCRHLQARAAARFAQEAAMEKRAREVMTRRVARRQRRST